MRLFSVRLIVSLIIGITLVSLLSSYYEVLGEKRTLRRDLERRADVLGESLVSNVERSWERDSGRDLQRIVQRFGNREHLIGIAVYDLTNKLIVATPDLANRLGAPPALLSQAVSKNDGASAFLHLGPTLVEMYAVPVHKDDQVVGGLVIVHDATYIHDQNIKTWRESFLRILLQVLVISVVTLLIVRWSVAGPIARAAQWMKALRTGRLLPQEIPDLDVFRPLAREVRTFAQSLSQARSAAQTEARLRDAGESLWTPERLAIHIQGRLEEGKLIVVSNREPYMHVRNGKAIDCIVPASGLVTALEPILRACSGTWVAHGSGDGDQETADRHGHLRVPPEDPQYTLRRVWLSKEEEQGYYYGFANEGLWPLCHIAHTRPIFRASDWQSYLEVNQKFADAVLEEIAGSQSPVVLVQDYHFALLPRFIKLQRPDARVAIFWHIPWPNPEAFGICPWRRELLEGLLGADLIGFHTQSHCNNFLESVDRNLESRIDWEHFSASRLDHRTIVRPFPISVDLTNGGHSEEDDQSNYVGRSAVFKSLGIEATLLGVGVDRVDYTKGILERFLAIERFLEKWPVYRGQFTFVQIGAPSRTHIKRYHDFLGEVELEAERINWRFQSGKWKPILFLKRQHSHDEITKYYRAADLCLVTSLHDGMNLVAKEFVAARSDERGVLILSQFTGAARELRDALLVNPYDIDETADALHRALEMEPEDKELRMQRMRKTVRENNVFRWAANLMTELCELRLDDSEATQEKVRSIASAS